MADATTTQKLPHWNLDQYFPGLESPEFITAFERMKSDTGAFSQLVEEVTGQQATGDTAANVERLLTALIELLDQVTLIMPYIHGHLAVNSRDEVAQRLVSEGQIALLPFHQANTRFTAWLGQQDVEAVIASSSIAKDHAYLLRQASIDAAHLMSQVEEDLASEMSLSGGSAFGKLHDDLTSQIMVRFEKRPGEEVELPMTEVRNLAMDPDRDVRRRAFDAEIDAWKQWETPIAAALNGVKGEHTTLARRRHWENALEQSLFQNHIDRKTLDAMMEASHELFPDIRRYYDAKAKALGLKKLMWYDITAPVGVPHTNVSSLAFTPSSCAPVIDGRDHAGTRITQ